ncbi:MAG: hypothetical protein WCO63_05555 [Bacteroidota bacterium]
MRTIKYTLAIVAFCLTIPCLRAQETAAKLSEAEKAFAEKNYDNTRFALQQALLEINKAIGKDILDILPKKLNDLNFNEKDDNISGAAGIAGLFVSRSYGAAEKSGSLEIMSDSPMLTSLNALLSMPAMMGASDPNQKRIKVNGYKSLLQKGAGENGIVTYDLQIPMNQTLVSLRLKGIPAENDVITIANSLPLDQIAKLAK